MSYSLGVDLGTTSCSAAYKRGPDVEPCALGDATTTMPTAVLPRTDGSLLVGEAADQRCHYEPALVARSVTGRLGDPEPVVVDGLALDPVALTEALIGTITHRASGGGEWPGHMVLTYPLRVGSEVEDVLRDAAARVTTSPVTLVPEPIAAMAKLAHDVELALDTTVVVVDFGGSSFDVTLVRRTDSGFDLVGDPASLADFGGLDLDAAVLSHVEAAVGDVTSSLRGDDHAGLMALRRLRASCQAAKEQLSTVPETVVDVMLPQVQTQVPVARRDLERAIEARLAEGVDLIAATIESAGLAIADVHVALLVGGSSRLPLLTQMVTERIGLPIVADPLPELTTSLGAAMFGEEDPAAAGPVDPSAVDESPLADRLAAASALALALPEPAAAAPAPPPAVEAPEPDAWDPLGPPPLGLPVDPAAALAATGPTPVPAPPGDNGWEQGDGPEWNGDTRSSVFDSIAPVSPGPPFAAGALEPVADDPYSRLTTADSDPFGTRSVALGGWLARQREESDHDDRGPTGHGDEPLEDGEDGRRGFGGSTDPRVVIGAIAAGLVVVLLGGFALAAGTGGSGDDTGIAVGNNNFITTTTAMPTADTDAPTTTTRSSTTTEGDTATTEGGTSETTRRRRTTTTDDPGTFPPGTSPATTPTTIRHTPPTTRPTTTTTKPTTTTTSTTSTTTTTTTLPPGP
jgi:molecular chaperone DnaK